MRYVLVAVGAAFCASICSIICFSTASDAVLRAALLSAYGVGAAGALYAARSAGERVAWALIAIAGGCNALAPIHPTAATIVVKAAVALASWLFARKALIGPRAWRPALAGLALGLAFAAPGLVRAELSPAQIAAALGDVVTLTMLAPLVASLREGFSVWPFALLGTSSVVWLASDLALVLGADLVSVSAITCPLFAWYLVGAAGLSHRWIASARR